MGPSWEAKGPSWRRLAGPGGHLWGVLGTYWGNLSQSQGVLAFAMEAKCNAKGNQPAKHTKRSLKKVLEYH